MKKLLCSVAVVGVLAVPSLLSAQANVGPVVAFHNDFDFGVGGYVSVPLENVNENLSVGGSFVLFFPGDQGLSSADFSYWELNADATLRIPIEADVTPFLLGGLNFASVSADVGIGGVGSVSNTDIGLNVGGGITFENSDSFLPFVGAKVELGGGEGFVLFAGLGFTVGG